jgi:uncharacterized protein (TIGR02996 family)
MTDDTALYRAIVARPEDDTPRLVYADWLEENGREQEAEFIRLECRLETATPDQPEYADLLDRQEELRLWLQTHAPGPRLNFGKRLYVESGNAWWRWTSRGFPQLQTFAADGHVRPGSRSIRAFAAALEKAFAMLPSRELNIEVLTIEELTELLKQPIIAALDSLLIQISTDEQTGDEAARVIANCQQLQNLRHASLMFPIGEAGADCLGRSEHLGRMEWLSLDAYNLSPPAIRSLGDGEWFRNLRRLTLVDGLSAEAFEELSRLPPFIHLNSLNLSENSFTVSAWREFARSKTFPRLTRLDLNETVMSDGQLAALAGANGFRLASLDLSFCSIGNEGAVALIEAPWAGSLRLLDLSFNRLGPIAMNAIAGCRHFAELKHLVLSGNPIGVTGLKAIARSPNFRNLTMMLLDNCSIRNNLPPAHFQEFLEKLDMPNLRYLDLTGMPIGPKASQLLTDDKFRNLTRLCIGHCKLTDEAVTELIASQTLQNLIELGLEFNGVKTGVMPLKNRGIFPRLSRCNLAGNAIAPELCRKLSRRPGVEALRQRSR